MDKQQVKDALVEQFSLAKITLLSRSHSDEVSCLVGNAFRYLSMEEFKELARSVFSEEEFSARWPNLDLYYISVVQFRKRQPDAQTPSL